MSIIRVDQIYPVTKYGSVKGFMPYASKAKSKVHIDRIQEVFDMLRAQDALPVGPRQVGYRLKEAHRGQYLKEVKRATRRTPASRASGISLSGSARRTT
jgi:hypothetical protein